MPECHLARDSFHDGHKLVAGRRLAKSIHDEIRKR
jgi:hypothetical protein